MNLSIKNVDTGLVERPRLRAKRHHRSLQGEMLAIIEEALHGRADETQEYRTTEAADAMRGLQEAHQTLQRKSGSQGVSHSVAGVEVRDQAVDRAIELMRQGLSFKGQRFTRDEMHER